MASVGWKRQYETETLYRFAMMMKIVAERKPEDAEAAAFARKARLVATMQISQEEIDLKSGDPARDRFNDCAVCKKQNGDRCYRDFNEKKDCIYERADVKLRVIMKHFGEEAKRWIEEAGKIAEAELEAKA